jgi:ATP-dependent Clp endopeptidase proteolytic subunit ClpP
MGWIDAKGKEMKTISVIAVLCLLGCMTAVEPVRKPIPIQLEISGVNAVKVQRPDDGIHRSMEVKNYDGQLSPMMFISGGEAYFKVFAYIGTMDSSNLWQDITILKDMGITKLNIYINSGGGSATDGLALADTIRYAIRQGINVTTYAVGQCASAAVVVFASGEKRIATESAQFMVHRASLLKYLSSEDSEDLEIQHRMLKQMTERYIGILVESSNSSFEEWDQRIRATTYFTAKKAQEWGLVDKVE